MRLAFVADTIVSADSWRRRVTVHRTDLVRLGALAKAVSTEGDWSVTVQGTGLMRFGDAAEAISAERVGAVAVERTLLMVLALVTDAVLSALSRRRAFVGERGPEHGVPRSSSLLLHGRTTPHEHAKSQTSQDDDQTLMHVRPPRERRPGLSRTRLAGMKPW
ncbi:hypothetical protein JY651_16630 [Pyxidicoccus parkwayensis]|uniref:Uncharacterized protein n=1 Tax=Pyxidicoccus parkwayensis TaxID=2813578 RepID=A0ABX7P7L2_9BACT|nr:hypothetical protein [Pyxidicoccus parkwaysis]QSQ26452.1 hypothetical protein JY651_16630 [Pyxidicoccus parkwaysis]